ncbi:hypothetical protein M2283_010316, partial [Streptomyces pseudovenezuelae]|nr:hypothetical protein [Streptomyces pseudovenezuelae]
ETSNTSPNGTGASCVAHTSSVTRSVATLKQLSYTISVQTLASPTREETPNLGNIFFK